MQSSVEGIFTKVIDQIKSRKNRVGGKLLHFPPTRFFIVLLLTFYLHMKYSHPN